MNASSKILTARGTTGAVLASSVLTYVKERLADLMKFVREANVNLQSFLLIDSSLINLLSFFYNKNLQQSVIMDKEPENN